MSNVKLSANVGRLWTFMASSLYKTDDPIVMATREALQNSVDAIHAACVPGRFDVEYNEERRTITWTDNGIGMDLGTIQSKFLTLGETGKSGDGAGGFGIAKAVILGATGTFRWKLKTRSHRLSCAGLDDEVETQVDAPCTGTSITIYDIPDSVIWRQSAIVGHWGGIPERIKELLSRNNLPIELYLNGELIPSKFQNGTIFPQNCDWGTGNTVTVRKYKRDTVGYSTITLQLNGLYQHQQPLYMDYAHNFVVDIKTTNRPGSRDYPFTASRDELRGAASSGYNALYRLIKQAAEAEAPREEEVIDADIYDEANLRMEMDDTVFAMLFLQALAKPTWKLRTTGEVQQTALEVPSEDKLCVNQTYATASPVAVVPDSVCNFGSVRINLKNYDQNRAAQFKANLAGFSNLAVLWAAALRVVAARNGITAKFNTGFVLDNSVVGQAIKQKGTENNVVYLNPDAFRTASELGHDATVEFLLNVATHELAHIANPWGVTAHGDAFASTREQFGLNAWAIRPVIAHLVERFQEKEAEEKGS